jgi:transcriptional regulator with XRE-family HTH domain
MRLDALRAPVPEPEAVLAKATLAAARRLGVTNRELARILGTSDASISRLARDRTVRLESAEARLAALFLRLFRSLDSIVGGDEGAARAWFRSDNLHLGGVPSERVHSVEGLVDVVHYLDAVRGKL